MPTNEIHGTGHLDYKLSQPAFFNGQGFHIATALIENIRDAVIITDVDYLITGWNKGAEEVYGYAKEEVLGRKARDIIQTQFASDKERIQWQQALDNTNNWQGEVIQKKRNGENIHVLASIASIKDDTGKIIGAVAVNRNITERKKAGEDLKNSKDVLQLTLENVPAAIYLFDYTGKIIFINEKAAILTGYSSVEEAMKEKDQQSLKNKASGLFEILNDKNEPIDFSQTPGSITIRTGKASELVHQSLNKKTGDIMWMLSKAEPLLDDNGNLKMVLASSTDITLQKTAEEKIKESGQRFSAAIEAVQGILWTNNPRGEMEGEQKGWAALTGQNYEEYQGYGWATAVHPEDAPSTVEAWNEAVQECKAFVFEHRVKIKDGNWGLFSIRAIPILKGDGSIREWVGVHTNITQQRKAEEMIRGNAERFRTLANSISQLAWMANPDGWIYWYNQRWYDYTGTTLEEMQGWGWQKVHHPEHIDRVMAFTKQAWNGNEPFEITFPLKGKNNNFRWFLTKAYPVKNSDGKVLEWIGTNTDIDDYKKAIELKDEFLGIASHELKTPLTSLKAFSYILETKLQQAENTEALTLLSKMNKQVDKLTTLVMELLDVTKIENGQLELIKENFNFSGLVQEIADEMQRSNPSHQINVDIGEETIIAGDRNRIGQAITNFISNAIKYSPNANKILISSHRKGNLVIFSVEDFGIGIPQESIPHVFERFFRVPGQRMQTFPGLGLGLFISAQVIERHNGNYKATSTEGKGSTFSFTLPV